MSDAALLDFLAHSTELEREAGERYTELAESLRTHNNLEVADFFARMAEESANHLAEVSAIADGRALPSIAPWDFEWPDAEAPETLSYETLHYRMTLREAMLLALGNEHAAERFYRRYAEGDEDETVRRVAAVFASEERSHAQRLERALEALPEVSTLARIDDDPPQMPE
ncbi:MAG: ferritin family protein [Halieaceae bacterium]|jgi:rubrerythrin|nr:ferritin family protein [Halieaceae bacterium]